MNWKLLGTMVTLIGVGASVALGQGTTPTIVQGDYISNVFGNSNFIKNPNAKLNTSNIAVSNATVTRSTTTPLVATSEANVTVTVANGTIAWSTRTFDAGMRNGNCEARFTYRGFQSTSIAQVRQGATVAGANVVAQLTLTPSATDPRVASINFPCGDLSQPTYFVITDTSTLAGTNEIGGIYVGLATNMANVAQAEGVVRAKRSTAKSIPASAETIYEYTTKDFDIYNEYDTTTGRFTAKRAGKYFIHATFLWASQAIATNEIRYISINKNGTPIIKSWEQQQTTSTRFVNNQISTIIDLSVGDYIEILGFQNGTVALATHNGADFNVLSISRFPSSSELVVKPETQNVFGGVKGYSSTFSNLVTSTTWTNITAGATLTRIPQGKASTAASNDYAITIDNLPVGSYFVAFTGDIGVQSQAGSTLDTTECNVSLTDGTTRSGVSTVYGVSTSAAGTIENRVSAVSGIFNYTSIGSRTWTLQMRRALGGGKCYANANTVDRQFQITVIPLDQPSNSALYVQGPVLGAQTGAAIPSGYQGETKTSSCTARVSASKTNGTYTDLSGNGVGGLAAITLEPGVWKIIGALPLGWLQWSSGANTAGWGSLSIRDGSNAIIEEQAFTFAGDFGANWYTSSLSIGGTTVVGIVRPTTSTTYKLSVVPSVYSGVPVWGDFSIGCDVRSAKITAVRIN